MSKKCAFVGFCNGIEAGIAMLFRHAQCCSFLLFFKEREGADL